MIAVRRPLVAVACAALVFITACGGSSNTAATTTTTTTAPTTTTLTEQQSKDQITAAFTAFFDGTSTDNTKKLNQLEDPDKSKDLFQKGFANPANAASAMLTTATVTDIKLTDASHADVTFTLNVSGTPALKDFKGGAILVNGTWKITTATFCDISALGDPSAAADPLCA
jgi:hypothetical protein